MQRDMWNVSRSVSLLRLTDVLHAQIKETVRVDKVVRTMGAEL